MEILWDSQKNDWLILNRKISFEQISDLLIEKRYIDIIENPSRKDQSCFVLKIEKYIWLVPFIIDQNDNIILKTAFPSRKYNKIFGGNSNEKN